MKPDNRRPTPKPHPRTRSPHQPAHAAPAHARPRQAPAEKVTAAQRGTGDTVAQTAPQPVSQTTEKVAATQKGDARKLGSSYLPGLDGLRAIAVLAVLLYHIAPNQFVGGYVGVDFFFVISGFLITYNILRKVGRPDARFSLKEFWLRRIRRLFPALVLLVLVCVPLGALIYPELLVGGLRQVLGALTCSTNWVEIVHGSNYFDQANPMLFKNLWSVAVEEQFYLIWPPILLALLAHRLSHRKLLGVAGGIAVASLVLMGVLASPDNYTRVYYGTDTHCFGLALGILLAFVWSTEDGPLSREWLRSRRWAGALPLVGLVGFCAIVMLFPDTSRLTYPLGLLLASLCSLALVAGVVARPASAFTRAMELAPVRWLGTRSYGIYLWHWPLLVFGRILVPTAVGTVENVVVDVAFVLVSFVISELSYRFVEEPFRRDGILRSLERIAGSARTGWAGRAQVATCAVLAVATVVAIATAPAKTQLQQQIEALQAQQDAEQQAAEQQGADDGAAADAGDADGEGATDGEGTDGTEPQGTDGADGEDDGEGATAPQDGDADTSSIPNYDASQATGVPDGSTVTAIGDSLISGTSSGFNAELNGINFLAAPIRQWGDAVQVVNEGLQEGAIRQNVILDFGTNGGVSDENLVYQVIDALGPNRRILLYNIYSPSTFVDASNELYARIADEYPNVHLVDWASVARAHPEYLNADRTHPNMTGMYPFVDVAVDTFAQS